MRAISSALLLVLASCDVGNDSLYTGSLSEKNIGNLARLEVGMDKSTVLRIMHKPYETEKFMVGNDNYELWYYVTTVTGLGQTRMVPMNVTPLAMKNGTLVGWGYEYYRWLTREQYLEKKPKINPADEDKSIEKTLQTAPPLKVLTMSKAPDKSKEPPPKQDDKDKKKKPLLSPEDEERLEEESEQNFNFW